MVDSRLQPPAFFRLDQFAHGDLLAGADSVWQILDRLRPWLAARPRANQIDGKVAAGAYLVGDGIHIGAGTVVEAGAYIRGPCVIGRDCEIRHGAYLRGHVVAGDGCVIGHASEVKGSVLLDGAKAGHFAYVGDSILGQSVNLGAGTKLANLRFDERTVRIRVDGEWVDTGRRKLGAILGDGVETGCNSVTNPGTLLPPGTRVLPCHTVGGYQPASD